MSRTAAGRRLRCFGAEVTIEAVGEDAAKRVESCRDLALEVHAALTRFEPDSELSRFNRDPRERVRASGLLRRLAVATREAGELSGGLVDATCIDAVEDAGYRTSLPADHRPAPAEPGTSERRPAIPDPAASWRLVTVDEPSGEVCRPPGVRLDSGGLGKGLAADLMAELLAPCWSFAVDCGGDLRVGGRSGAGRRVIVAGAEPGAAPVAELSLARGAVATSGVRRRSWTAADGSTAHHLIDPGRSTPAQTGIVQATAIAPTALEAEVRAKAALLGGLEKAPGWLVHGGVLVLDDGRVRDIGMRAGGDHRVAA
jgi:thiamine biosynthesis lipoprotein